MAHVTPIAETGRRDAIETLERSIKQAEQIRRDLASTYAFADGGSDEEHELGECLTKIRAALRQMRKSTGELAQGKLGLE